MPSWDYSGIIPVPESCQNLKYMPAIDYLTLQPTTGIFRFRFWKTGIIPARRCRVSSYPKRPELCGLLGAKSWKEIVMKGTTLSA